MAIGDSWQTINTYAFTAGQTIITAAYENDVVNDLQYLYNNIPSLPNAFTASATATLSASASNVAVLSTTITPKSSKLLVTCHWFVSEGVAVPHGYSAGNGILYPKYCAINTNNYDFPRASTTYGWGDGSSIIGVCVPNVANSVAIYATNTHAATNTIRSIVITILEVAS